MLSVLGCCEEQSPCGKKWQRDGIPVWASPHKSILKKGIQRKKLGYWEKRSVAQPIYCLLSQCLGCCLRGAWSPSPHPEWNQQKLRSSAFSSTNHFSLPAPLLLPTLVWGTGVQSVLCHLKLGSCMRLSPQMPGTVTFWEGLRLLLNSLQCTLHLWLSSLNKLLSLLTNAIRNILLRWIRRIILVWNVDFWVAHNW